jgi:DNA helicase-2/ATP-dependent DNA helicase PcrA
VLVVETLERSGYGAMLKADVDEKGNLTKDAESRLQNLEELVHDAASFPMPADAVSTVDHLTAWMDRAALTGADEEIPEGGEVTLLTVHSSKGLEYPVVFVVQMNEGVFPHARSFDTGIDEERRLAYVAFTRAMKRLVVTRSQTDARSSKAASPSRFLFGLPGEVVDGDLPMGDPESSPQELRADTSERRSKRATFFETRRARAVAPPEEHTLVDIESMEDLVPGARVHHPRFGMASIAKIQGHKVQLDFGGAGRRWLAMQQLQQLQLVLD